MSCTTNVIVFYGCNEQGDSASGVTNATVKQGDDAGGVNNETVKQGDNVSGVNNANEKQEGDSAMVCKVNVIHLSFT